MASPKVMTAPLAIIKTKAGVEIGKMKNIRIRETIRRTPVKGLGVLIPSEMPATDWSGSLQCAFYLINLKATGLPLSIHRDTNQVKEFVDSLLLNEDGVDVYLYRKTPKKVDANGIVTETGEEPLAVIRGVLIDSDGFDISEGQIAGRDQSFQYMNPVLYST